ncbi:hypothetical protein ACFPK9_05210 [Rubritalea spongiae]|uniref:Transporter n=1 Tax=Rubritalea spongiae TaxID=430797 RepID=A0ABW5E4N6_9BACT
MSRQRSIICALSLISLCSANASEEIPYGIEFLAQYRSEYNYRGFILAQDTLDLQVSSQLAFNKTTYLTGAAWFGTEASDGDFSEAGFLADLRKDIEQWTLSLSGSYRSYSNSFFENGANIEAAAFYQWNTQFQSSAHIAYDTGAEAWYSSIESSFYHRINDDSFLNFDIGVSAVEDYYSRDGLNDAFGKISYTYNINQSLSISPYIGTSILLDNKESGRDSLYGGIYLAVTF